MSRSIETQRRQARRYREKYYTGIKPHDGLPPGPKIDVAVLAARRSNLDAYAAQSDIDRLLGIPPSGRSALDARRNPK